MSIEPFGYFKAEPFGWTDCAETEAGAVPLYERSAIDNLEAQLAAARREVAEQTSAARDVLAERQRQISAEGWMPEHDDQHAGGELARTAACYALTAWPRSAADAAFAGRLWPWGGGIKTTTRRRDLVKAGALILAEIERMDREAACSPAGERADRG